MLNKPGLYSKSSEFRQDLAEFYSDMSGCAPGQSCCNGCKSGPGSLNGDGTIDISISPLGLVAIGAAVWFFFIRKK